MDAKSQTKKNLDLISNAANAVPKCLNTVYYYSQLLPHELVEKAT